MSDQEIHIERLVGRRVRDVDGKVVGRIEEFVIGYEDGEPIIREYLLGQAGLIQRLGGAALQLPFLRALPFDRRSHRVPWQQLDLANPLQPRLRCRAGDLEPA